MIMIVKLYGHCEERFLVFTVVYYQILIALSFTVQPIFNGGLSNSLLFSKMQKKNMYFLDT